MGNLRNKHVSLGALRMIHLKYVAEHILRSESVPRVPDQSNAATTKPKPPSKD